jgi:hypothetical protein
MSDTTNKVELNNHPLGLVLNPSSSEPKEGVPVMTAAHIHALLYADTGEEHMRIFNEAMNLLGALVDGSLGTHDTKTHRAVSVEKLKRISNTLANASFLRRESSPEVAAKCGRENSTVCGWLSTHPTEEKKP